MLRAIFWIMGTNLCFTTTLAISKTLSPDVSNFVLLSARYFFGSLLLVSIISAQKELPFAKLFKTKRLMWQMIRVMFVLIATGLTYFAYRNLPLPVATSIGFSGPLFTAIFAILFLGEKMTKPKAISLILGYTGVLIIVRPDASSGLVLMAFFAALGANAFAALGIVTAKYLTKSDHTLTIQSFSTFLTFVIASLIAVVVWKTPSIPDLAILACMGCFGTFGQLCYIRAIKLADASFVSPFEYSRLLLAIPIGYFFFDEHVDSIVMIGVCFIILGTYRLIRGK